MPKDGEVGATRRVSSGSIQAYEGKGREPSFNLTREGFHPGRHHRPLGLSQDLEGVRSNAKDGEKSVARMLCEIA